MAVIATDSADGSGSVSWLVTDAVSVIVPTELAPVWTTIVTVAEAPAGIVPRLTSGEPPPDIGITMPWLGNIDWSDTPEGSWSLRMTLWASAVPRLATVSV